MELRFPDKSELEGIFSEQFPLEQREYLVDGQITRWSGETQEVLSPVCWRNDGKVERVRIGSFPKLSSSEARDALGAARNAYDRGNGLWPTSRLKYRVECMDRFVHMMTKRREEVVNLLMWEIGKNRKDSEKEFDRTVDYIRDTIDAVKDMDRKNSRPTSVDGILAQIRRAPLGVVLCLGPYNYPLNETFALLIPALIMGNTVILKPPRHGVLLLGPLLDAFAESFPPGVINVIYGDGEDLVTPIMQSGSVDVLAFIGASRTASLLAKMHPKPNRLRHVFGLEAKNPAIVLPDVDIDLAVKECISGTLSFNGQRCTALKILFVHKSVRELFLTKYIAALDSLKMGLPWDEDVFVTPLPEKDKPELLKEMVDEAIAGGATVLNEGGGRITGAYFHPAVVFPVNQKMSLYHVEQFGPVVPVVEFDDISEPLNYMQNSDYGQQVSVFGSSPKEIGALVDGLVNQVCRVNINSQCQRGPDVFPFTGRKDSAQITLSVHDALRAFSIRTMAALKESDVNMELLEEILDRRYSNFVNDSWIV